MEYHREYRENNREAISERGKRYRENNREAIQEYQKKYYAENREAILERDNLAAIRTKAKMDYATKTSPVIESILTTASLLRSDQEREHYATWLLVLADSDDRVRRAVRHYGVDDFLGTCSGI
jgi:hypothetical protein